MTSNRLAKNPQQLQAFLETELAKPTVDVEALRSVAHLGFCNNALRKKIWPLLLGIGQTDIHGDFPRCISLHHQYYDQINKDVARSLFSFSITKTLPPAHFRRIRARLARMLHALFSSSPTLHYTQGFHDVCAVFVLVCDDAIANAQKNQQRKQLQLQGQAASSSPGEVSVTMSTSSASSTLSSSSSGAEGLRRRHPHSSSSSQEGAPEAVSSGSADEASSEAVVRASADGLDDNGDIHDDKVLDDAGAKAPSAGFLSQAPTSEAKGADEALAYALVQRLALVHLRDCLQPSLDRVMQLMSLVMPLLSVADPAVSDFLQRAETTSFFTLSWVLTWFAHNLSSLEAVARVFDFLLAAHPVMSVYLCVGVILALKPALLALPVDMPAVHEYFQNLPQDLDVSVVIGHARDLWRACPPSRLFAAEKLVPFDDSPMSLARPQDLAKFAGLGTEPASSASPSANATSQSTVASTSPPPPSSVAAVPNSSVAWKRMLMRSVAMLSFMRKITPPNRQQQQHEQENSSSSRLSTSSSTSSDTSSSSPALSPPPPSPCSSEDSNAPPAFAPATSPRYPTSSSSSSTSSPSSPSSPATVAAAVVEALPSRDGYDHILAKKVWGGEGRPDRTPAPFCSIVIPSTKTSDSTSNTTVTTAGAMNGDGVFTPSPVPPMMTKWLNFAKTKGFATSLPDSPTPSPASHSDSPAAVGMSSSFSSSGTHHNAMSSTSSSSSGRTPELWDPQWHETGLAATLSSKEERERKEAAKRARRGIPSSSSSGSNSNSGSAPAKDSSLEKRSGDDDANAASGNDNKRDQHMKLTRVLRIGVLLALAIAVAVQLNKKSQWITWS